MSEEQTGERSNAEKAIAENEIEIGGKKHLLKYTLWSFCKLDELTGKNPLVGSSWADIHPKDILGLLWAGLLHEEKPMSLEQLGQKIDVTDIARIAPIIQKAMAQSAPADDPEKKAPSSPTEPS